MFADVFRVFSFSRSFSGPRLWCGISHPQVQWVWGRVDEWTIKFLFTRVIRQLGIVGVGGTDSGGAWNEGTIVGRKLRDWLA